MKRDWVYIQEPELPPPVCPNCKIYMKYKETVMTECGHYAIYECNNCGYVKPVMVKRGTCKE